MGEVAARRLGVDFGEAVRMRRKQRLDPEDDDPGRVGGEQPAGQLSHRVGVTAVRSGRRAGGEATRPWQRHLLADAIEEPLPRLAALGLCPHAQLASRRSCASRSVSSAVAAPRPAQFVDGRPVGSQLLRDPHHLWPALDHAGREPRQHHRATTRTVSATDARAAGSRGFEISARAGSCRVTVSGAYPLRAARPTSTHRSAAGIHRARRWAEWPVAVLRSVESSFRAARKKATYSSVK
ncbi:hypothetical protein [Amycolatopsis sp. NPDC051903]|uniref:hypothetical protein n=1 Tax=Amycolatopsis sp. NPDC051903 TaxID=3363936 RepID=UPI0037BD1E70